MGVTEVNSIRWLECHIFVGSSCGIPTKVHKTLDDAKKKNHDYIEEFDESGSWVNSWIKQEDGSFTDDF